MVTNREELAEKIRTIRSTGEGSFLPEEYDVMLNGFSQYIRATPEKSLYSISKELGECIRPVPVLQHLNKKELAEIFYYNKAIFLIQQTILDYIGKDI